MASVLLPATTARAGALSEVIASLFGKRASAATVTNQATRNDNVQNMALPQAANNFDPNPSRGGGSIAIVDDAALLPEEGPSGTAADIPESIQSHTISVYVVRPGDTLSDIATMFGVTVNTVRWGNDLKAGEAIQPGQTLTILPISGVRHTVTKGDTLASIAKEYNGNLEEIVHYNGMPADAALSVGTEIIIPDGEIAAPAPTYTTTRTASTVRAASGPTYVGYYMRPVSGGVRTQGIHGYNGVDIAASAGTPIMAAAGGEVIISRQGGWNGGYGTYVVIRHDNGTQTLYAHNSSNIVSIGTRVVQGQVIGYMGSTGRSTGTHLHFEIRGAKNPF